MSKKMVIKILTAFLMLAIFVPPFVLGGIWLKVLLGIIGLLVACEIAALEDRKFHPVIILLLFAYFLCCILLPADWFMILNCIAVPVLFSIKLFTDAIETDAIPYHFLLMFISDTFWQKKIIISVKSRFSIVTPLFSISNHQVRQQHTLS